MSNPQEAGGIQWVQLEASPAQDVIRWEGWESVIRTLTSCCRLGRGDLTWVAEEVSVGLWVGGEAGGGVDSGALVGSVVVVDQGLVGEVGSEVEVAVSAEAEAACSCRQTVLSRMTRKCMYIRSVSTNSGTRALKAMTLLNTSHVHAHGHKSLDGPPLD